jgi:hypothetical protein
MTKQRRKEIFDLFRSLDMPKKVMIKVGDVVNLDCGYGLPDDQDCRVLRIALGEDVWGNPVYNATVLILSTAQQFNTTFPVE